MRLLLVLLAAVWLCLENVDGHGAHKPNECGSNDQDRCYKLDSGPIDDSFVKWSLFASLATCSASALCALILLSGTSNRHDNTDRMAFFLSFAAGGMLGDVFLHILPHLSHEDTNIVAPGVLLGIFVFFLLDLVIGLSGHDHTPSSVSSVGILNLVSDALHNFTDGIMVAVAFKSSFPLGRSTTLAILLHELPQEMGDFSILLRSGLSWSKALFLNVCCSAFALLGTGFTIVAQSNATDIWSTRALAVTAGGLIYTATAGVISELRKLEHEASHRPFARRIVSVLVEAGGFALGVGAMRVLLDFEAGGNHSHSH